MRSFKQFTILSAASEIFPAAEVIALAALMSAFFVSISYRSSGPKVLPRFSFLLSAGVEDMPVTLLISSRASECDDVPGVCTRDIKRQKQKIFHYQK